MNSNIKRLKKPELLAPAGDFEKLKFALAYGADAVYVGGSAYGLRAYAGNFKPEELKRAIQYTHQAGRKIYVTVNIFAHEEDFEGMAEYLQQLESWGADAAIVSDPGIIALAQEVAPKLALHLSTQANSTNSQSIRFWLKHGIERIVLARELTEKEIAQVREKVSGELEMFVHGAMCMSYSGRCLLSNYLTGRDANRGECTQPCRWSYGLVEEKRPNEVFPIEEDRRGAYIFNSHDLCLLPYLPLLKSLEVDSYKIEGRMKSVHYVSCNVKAYREAIDTLWELGEEAFREKLPGWLAEMDKVSHRDYSTGFLFGKPGAEAHNLETSNYIREYNFVGVGLSPEELQQAELELDMDKANLHKGFWVEQRNYFRQGNVIEVLTPEGEPWSFEVKQMWDIDGEPVEVANHAKQILRLELPKPLSEFSILRKPKVKKYQ
ncbi:U32 family peptidase [Desulfitobacterium sp.]|uniref:peptidase U32 family protein n=1 Tax=Desulfitobacterium sp. TaxID=49981 RepID=UPI002B1E9473|nr:U32 family peptidase [Desulfitobacterium sp.]MEA4900439.1 U32 family peptidase [Desulfitobacterium sp.]